MRTGTVVVREILTASGEVKVVVKLPRAQERERGRIHYVV